MHRTSTKPYLTAVLRASHVEFDLSGRRPFTLEVAVTLHAPNSITIYTPDTFLAPSAALRAGGITFLRMNSDSEPEPRSTIDVNRGNGPYRPWSSANFLTLEPRVSTLIAIPFGSPGLSVNAGSPRFDLRLWMNTMTFKKGESYEAILPNAVKVTWWRWVTLHEVQCDAQAKSQWLAVVWSAANLWWQGRDNDDQGVPILPEEQQLEIYTLESGVIFTCVGNRMEPSRE